MELGRRQFVTAGISFAAGVAAVTRATGKAAGEETWKAPPLAKGLKRMKAPPVLQCPAETTVGVSWAVDGLAYGDVEIADNPEFRGSKKFRSGGLGLAAMDDGVLQVRVTGLKPATRYWYRVATTPIADWKNCYSFRIGEAEVGHTYSFTTAGAGGSSKICAINDTHCNWGLFGKVTALAASMKPVMLVWNGDATNWTDSKSAAVTTFLAPKIGGPGYATAAPVAYVPGNHEFRGKWAKRFGEVMLERTPDERSGRDWELGRNFAVRVGDVAAIGLDTGEDKPDWHPKWLGLANFSPYRKAQARWLEEQLEREEIKSAKFAVAFCHIPLYDPDPEANPGDRMENWADWQKECADAWGPLFEKHGVGLVVAGHMHKFRWDEPGAGRSWAQIVGGGTGGKPDNYPTVIELDVAEGRLKVRAVNALTGETVCEKSIEQSPARKG